MRWLNENVTGKQWIIKIVDDKFLVGALNPRTKVFDPICSCESYFQAELILMALDHYIYAKNYSSRGVAGCPGGTVKNLKRTVKMGIPG